MSISFPRSDVMDVTKLIIQSPGFYIFEMQEIARQRSGQIRARIFSDPIWKANFVTPTMTQDDCIDFEAVLRTLQRGLQPFEARDTRREYPRLYPTGVFNDTGQIAAFANNRTSVEIDNLDANFALKRGDKFSVTYGGVTTLHEVSEDVTADGSGATGEFDIIPSIGPDVPLNSIVRFKKPPCHMVIEPGTISYNPGASALGTVSFSALQFL